MKILISSCDDPYVNLSLEAQLLANARDHTLFLWQNAPAVIIGRNQTIWNEVSYRYVKKHHIQVLRRESGGGAVYHDKGNLNFSLISPRPQYSLDTNFNYIIATLHRVGIKATRAHNNSITVGGHKISGSAFRFTNRAVLHHGTLLVGANITHLTHSLVPDYHSRSTRGIPSRVAPVTNIGGRTLNVATLRMALVDNVGAWNSSAVGMLPAVQERHLKENDFVHHHTTMLKSWEWKIARSPHATLIIKERRSAKALHAEIGIEWGVVGNIQLNSASKERSVILAILQVLIGKPIDPSLHTHLKEMRATLKNKPMDAGYRQLSIRLLNAIGGLVY